MKRTLFSLSLLLYSLSVHAQTWSFTSDAEFFRGTCSGINTTRRIVFTLSNTAKSVITSLDAPIPSPFAIPIPNLALDSMPVRDGLEKNVNVSVTNAAGAITTTTPYVRKIWRWSNDILMTPYMEGLPYSRGWISEKGDASNAKAFPGAITSLTLKNSYTIPTVQTYLGPRGEFFLENANPCADRYGFYVAVWMNWITKPPSVKAGQRMFELTPDLQRVGLEPVGFVGPDGASAYNAVLANGKFTYNSDGTVSFAAPMGTWSQGSGNYDVWGPLSSDGLHVFNRGNAKFTVSNSTIPAQTVNTGAAWTSDGKYLILSTGPRPASPTGIPMGVPCLTKCIEITTNTVKWTWTDTFASGLISDGVAVMTVYPQASTAPLPNCIIAVDVATGNHLWLRQYGGTATKDLRLITAPLNPQAAGNGMLFCSQGNDLVGLDLRSGREVWRAVGTPYLFVQGLALLSNTLICASSTAYAVFDAATGRLLNTVITPRGTYTVFIANRMLATLGSGWYSTSSFRLFECPEAKLTPNLPLAVTLPAAQAGDRLSCFATGTNVRYQWQKDGTDIDGAKSRWLTVTTPGSYACSIASDNGNAPPLPVAVGPLPYALEPYLILSGDKTYFPGDTLNFTAFAGGDAVTYRWLLNDTTLPTTGDTLTLTTDAAMGNAVIACTGVDKNGNQVALGSISLILTGSPVPTPLPENVAYKWYNQSLNILWPITLTAGVSNPTGQEVFTWQQRASSSVAWVNVTNAVPLTMYYTANQLNIKKYSLGQQFRFIVTTPAGRAESNPCTVVVSTTTTTTTTTGSK